MEANLKGRWCNKFIPQWVKKIFKVLEEIGDLNADMILDKFTWMYDHDHCFSCTKLWEDGCGGGGVFVWIRNIEIVWPKTETLGNAAVKLTWTVGWSLCWPRHVGLQTVIYGKLGTSDCKEIWLHMFNHFNDQNISYQFLTSLCCVLLTRHFSSC